MDPITNDIIKLLQYLLPGFVTAWVFYSFTSYPKPSQFERVVQALIFTIFIQAISHIIKYVYNFLPIDSQPVKWNNNVNIVCLLTIAVLIGIIFSYYANNDKFHKLLRKLKITKETSYSSEWFSAFSEKITYVVLHLKDERRIYGWPMEWPTEPNKGHFVLSKASWLLEDNSQVPLEGVESILIDASSVELVEFMEKTWEKNNVKESI
jgi:hypothetical protein